MQRPDVNAPPPGSPTWEDGTRAAWASGADWASCCLLLCARSTEVHPREPRRLGGLAPGPYGPHHARLSAARAAAQGAGGGVGWIAVDPPRPDPACPAFLAPHPRR